MANTTVKSEQIEDGSITADKIADGAIVATELADNAVTTAKINADAVTGAKIADDAINSEHYTDGSIDTAHIADDQVTQAKIADDAVGADQLAASAVVTASIVDDNVTTAKIADGNISTALLADTAVTSAKLANNIDIAGTFDVTGATTLDSTATVAGTLTATKLVSSNGVLELDDNGSHNGIINVPASITINIDSDDGATNETFSIAKDKTAINDTDVLFRVQEDGKVGIGTTSPVSSSTLTLNGNQSALALSRNTGTDVTWTFSSDAANMYLSDDGNVTYNMTWKNDGKVGIGTTSPTERFQVNHTGVETSSIRSSATDNDAYFAVGNSDMSDFIVLFGGHTANPSSTVGWDDSNNLRFATYQNHTGTFGTERMRIDTSGNFIVGDTAAPSGSNSCFQAATGGTISTSRAATNTQTHHAFLNPNGTVGSITTNASATAYNTSSDARLKDVTGEARGLEVINALNPVAYSWKADGKTDEGLIAQEVLDIVPNAVSGSEENYYQMDYSKLVTHLVAGMKEQQTIIDDLKARIETLEG